MLQVNALKLPIVNFPTINEVLNLGEACSVTGPNLDSDNEFTSAVIMT